MIFCIMHTLLMTKSIEIGLGNNETVSSGVFAQDDGSFLAMTCTESKTFKTRNGAERWHARKTGK
jgi:hypothetical protein